MARPKGELWGQEKREEILAVARRLFVSAGYDGTRMGRLAEEVGVAPNTIYWYFADKDAVLIAVLDGLVADALHDFQTKKKLSLEEQVLWLLKVLESAESLITTVHARVAQAPTLRVWHDNFHRMLEALLIAELREHAIEPADLPYAAQVAMFVVEGLLAHPSSTKERRALVRWLVSRLQPEATPEAKGERVGVSAGARER